MHKWTVQIQSQAGLLFCALTTLSSNIFLAIAIAMAIATLQGRDCLANSSAGSAARVFTAFGMRSGRSTCGKCTHLQIIAGDNLVNDDGAAVKLKGILFDVEEFWMIHSSGSDNIVEVEKCKWTQKGSRKVSLDFLSAAEWNDL